MANASDTTSGQWFGRVGSTWVVASAVILIVAAGAKLWTAATNLRLLELVDPLLFVRNRYVLLGVALIELVCVIILLRESRLWFKGLILLWLGTNFVLYRMALLLSGAETPCPCLGSLGGRLGLSSSQTELLTKGMAAFLLAVGFYLFVRHRPRTGNHPDESSQPIASSDGGACQILDGTAS